MGDILHFMYMLSFFENDRQQQQTTLALLRHIVSITPHVSAALLKSAALSQKAQHHSEDVDDGSSDAVDRRVHVVVHDPRYACKDDIHVNISL